MKALYAGSLIWVKTVFFNAFLFAIGSLYMNDWSVVLLSFLVLIVGFVGTLPLLTIVVPLVGISAVIPYSTKAKIAWLCFYLLVLILIFYTVIAAFGRGILDADSKLYQLMASTIAGLFIAVFTTRRSLHKLYNSNTQKHII
jgi:hypothetical protein